MARHEYIEFNNNLFPYPEYNSSLPTSANAVAEDTIAEDTIAEETIVEEPAAIVEDPARPKRGRPKNRLKNLLGNQNLQLRN